MRIRRSMSMPICRLTHARVRCSRPEFFQQLDRLATLPATTVATIDTISARNYQLLSTQATTADLSAWLSAGLMRLQQHLTVQPDDATHTASILMRLCPAIRQHRDELAPRSIDGWMQTLQSIRPNIHENQRVITSTCNQLIIALGRADAKAQQAEDLRREVLSGRPAKTFIQMLDQILGNLAEHVLESFEREPTAQRRDVEIDLIDACLYQLAKQIHANHPDALKLTRRHLDTLASPLVHVVFRHFADQVALSSDMIFGSALYPPLLQQQLLWRILQHAFLPPAAALRRGSPEQRFFQMHLPEIFKSPNLFGDLTEVKSSGFETATKFAIAHFLAVDAEFRVVELQGTGKRALPKLIAIAPNERERVLRGLQSLSPSAKQYAGYVVLTTFRADPQTKPFDEMIVTQMRKLFAVDSSMSFDQSPYPV